jgi:nucleoid-associated protein YgaU
MFFKGSRYAKVPEAQFVDSERTGRVIVYKTVRFIPDTPAQVGHRVVGGERLDLIAFEHYRDAERFWRICDANRGLWPADLLVAGRVIGIPSAEA